MKTLFWFYALLLSLSAAGCGDAKRDSTRLVEAAADAVGYTPERLTEYKSVAECATVVTKFQAQREVINATCGAMFSEGLASDQDFRKNLLCLRHDLEKTDNFQQAREVVGTCAKDFPSERTTYYASHLMVETFPTTEQQQINQLKAQNKRLEAAQQEEKYAQSVRDANQRLREIDQNTAQRLREINQNYTNQMNEINARAQQQLLERQLQNPSFRCRINGDIIDCN